MILLIKLLLAHLIGDFLLQPTSWVIDKENKRLKSKYLYAHILIHTVLAGLALGDWNNWYWGIFIGIIHGIIDASKLLFQKEHSKRRWFIADQLMHVLSLLLFCFYLDGNLFFNEPSEYFYITFTAAVFLTKPASILIKTLISVWMPQANDQSLENAGNYIGMMERLLILCFILTNHFEAIGFLLGAKSIFRFGDLTANNDRKLTEYVLIGTLLSFGLAIITGLLTQNTLIDF